MARIKIELPDTYAFTTSIAVRITDLNYGGHVGNDIVLSMIHEARVQYLQHYGYKELDLSGVGLIMSDVAIEFKKEIFYGDRLKVSVTAGEFSSIGFDIYYKLEKELTGQPVLAAISKTDMVCYDYSLKKIARLPDEVRMKLQG